MKQNLTQSSETPANQPESLNNRHYYLRVLPRARNIKNLEKFYIIKDEKTRIHTSGSEKRTSRKPPSAMSKSNALDDASAIKSIQSSQSFKSDRPSSTFSSIVMRFSRKPKADQPEYFFDRNKFPQSPRIQGIPLVLDFLVSYIENFALELDGIFRTCGCHRKILELVAMLNRDFSEWDIQSPLWSDSPLVVSTFKCVLRSFSPYFGLGAITREVVEVSRAGKDGLLPFLLLRMRQLHGFSLNLLIFVLRHLARVGANSSSNRMTPKSLGIVFAPIFFDSLLKPDKNVVATTKCTCEVTAILIENYDTVGVMWTLDLL